MVYCCVLIVSDECNKTSQFQTMSNSVKVMCDNLSEIWEQTKPMHSLSLILMVSAVRASQGKIRKSQGILHSNLSDRDVKFVFFPIWISTSKIRIKFELRLYICGEA